MTCYSVQPRDKIFVKSYVFLIFAKSMVKTIGKNVGKKKVNTVRNLLIMWNHLQQMYLKVLQKQ